MIETSESTPLSFPPDFPTERKIRGFKKLENGWHYGEGVAFEQSILDNAIALHQEVIHWAFFETDAFPGLNGEVVFTIYFDKHYLEFTLEPDDSVTFYQEKNGEEIYYQEGLSFQEAKVKIREFRKRVWRESESSTRYTMTTGYVDFRASHSRIQETIQESQSLVENAYLNQGERSVSIFENITRELPANHPFSGVSQQRYYRIATG